MYMCTIRKIRIFRNSTIGIFEELRVKDVKKERERERGGGKEDENSNNHDRICRSTIFFTGSVRGRTRK